MIPKLPKGFSHPMRIGEGTFASVYRVRQNALERWVALKIIPEKDRDRRKELLKEATIQAKIKAECIPQVYDAFEWNNSVCIVMQWVKGVSLVQLMRGTLSEEERLFLANGLICSLATLHSLGFAHRDLKPANVLISPPDGVFLVDFGFTKDVADGQKSVALTAKGTPAYMAPEIWNYGGNVDLIKADLYSAGKILSQILSDTSASGFTEILLQEDPQKRPDSGVKILELWKEQNSCQFLNHDWEKIAGHLASEILSVKLLLAAKELNFAGRHEEAYWLCVESLEQNANNAEALEFIGRFSQQQRKNGKSLKTYMGLVLLVSVLLTIAFFAGRKTGTVSELSYVHKKGERNQLITFKDKKILISELPLKQDSLHSNRFMGMLMFKGFPDSSRILIDNRLSKFHDDLKYGISLDFGEHDLALVSEDGKINWHEKVKILPFQRKVVRYTGRKVN